MENQIITIGAGTALRANTFENEGFQFIGWATSAAGAVEYAPGATSVTAAAGATVALFAVWLADDDVGFTISFDTQGGSLVADIFTNTDGILLTIPADPTHPNAAMTFMGWSLTKDGEVIDLETYEFDEDTTVFAIWDFVRTGTCTNDWCIDPDCNCDLCGCECGGGGGDDPGPGNTPCECCDDECDCEDCDCGDECDCCEEVIEDDFITAFLKGGTAVTLPIPFTYQNPDNIPAQQGWDNNTITAAQMNTSKYLILEIGGTLAGGFQMVINSPAGWGVGQREIAQADVDLRDGKYVFFDLEALYPVRDYGSGWGFQFIVGYFSPNLAALDVQRAWLYTPDAASASINENVVDTDVDVRLFVRRLGGDFNSSDPLTITGSNSYSIETTVTGGATGLFLIAINDAGWNTSDNAAHGGIAVAPDFKDASITFDKVFINGVEMDLAEGVSMTTALINNCTAEGCTSTPGNRVSQASHSCWDGCVNTEVWNGWNVPSQRIVSPNPTTEMWGADVFQNTTAVTSVKIEFTINMDGRCNECEEIPCECENGSDFDCDECEDSGECCDECGTVCDPVGGCDKCQPCDECGEFPCDCDECQLCKDAECTCTFAVITFNLNYEGATGAPAAITRTGQTIASPTAPTRDDFTFLGWARTTDGAVVANLSTIENTRSNFILYAIWEEDDVTPDKVATPVIGGTFSGTTANRTVTITTATEGARIFYTIDGTAPSATNGTEIASGGTFPISLSNNQTITVRAIAVKDGYDDSDVATRGFSRSSSTGPGGPSGPSGPSTGDTTPTDVIARPGQAVPSNFEISTAIRNRLAGEANLPVIAARFTTTGTKSINFGTTDVAGQNAILVRLNAQGELEVVSAVVIGDDGIARINVTATGDYLVLARKTGDITGTGEVTTTDALALLRHIAGIAELDLVQLFVANGKMDDNTTSDALQILRLVAGIISSI
jgi:uncharacterized repeat protein (TIGR02543 family)